MQVCAYCINVRGHNKDHLPQTLLFRLPPLSCRCAVGGDWWYYGDRCQSRGSISEKTNLVLASSLSVLGAMVIITVISVICVKRKYSKKSKSDAGVDLGAQRL